MTQLRTQTQTSRTLTLPSNKTALSGVLFDITSMMDTISSDVSNYAQLEKVDIKYNLIGTSQWQGDVYIALVLTDQTISPTALNSSNAATSVADHLQNLLGEEFFYKILKRVPYSERAGGEYANVTYTDSSRTQGRIIYTPSKKERRVTRSQEEAFDVGLPQVNAYIMAIALETPYFLNASVQTWYGYSDVWYSLHRNTVNSLFLNP